MHARRTHMFLEQESDLVTETICIDLTLPLRKSCSVHMTVFRYCLLIAMLTDGHNQWHDVSGRKQLIYKF